MIDYIVWGVFALETAVSIVTTRATYALLCENWGNQFELSAFTSADAAIPIISALGMSLVLNSYLSVRCLCTLIMFESVGLGPDFLCLAHIWTE